MSVLVRAAIVLPGDYGAEPAESPALHRAEASGALVRARQTCKPGSVSREDRSVGLQWASFRPQGTVTIYLGPALPLDSSGQPGDGPNPHSPPIWPCSRWGLATAASPRTAGRSYRPFSPLPRNPTWGNRGGTVSVPLSVSSLVLRTHRAHITAEEPGRYPAPCPVEPRLSSPPTFPRVIGRVAYNAADEAFSLAARDQ